MAYNSALHALIGKQLSAVSFVQDYLQLQYDGDHLNLYSWPLAKTKELILRMGMQGYRDLLCAQIGHCIASIDEESDGFTLYFETGVSLSISLREEDRSGPEAAMLQAQAGTQWKTWP